MFDPVHISTLKRMALSPAHYQAAVAKPWDPTRAMVVGTVTHHLVLGPRTTRPIVQYRGDARRGKEWEAFRSAHLDYEIATAPEWADALPIAQAVADDPVACRLLGGTKREVPLSWDDAGIACATDGVDAIGDGYLVDLKTTSCTEPQAWQRHAAKLLYHAQMAWYETGAIKNGIDTSKGLFLIGVESSEPYAVTCMRLTPETIEQGRKTVAIWLEKLRSCREANFWPTYTQSVIDFDLPSWMGGGDDENG